MMIALNDKATMANELNSMYIRKTMTLQQMRFFTIYLAKINPKNPESKIVKFSVKDFANIMNVEVNENDIKTNIVNLLEHTVWVKSEKYKNGITACHLFRKSEMWADDETGELMIEFQCSDEIEPYLFKLKKNFTSYEVWNTLRLRSVIHSRMYQLLKQFQKIGERTISIADLKEQLGIEKNAYPEYKIFSRAVLKKCQEALKEKTDIYFDYKPVGRPAKSIRFTIYENKNYDKKLSFAEIGLDEKECEPESINKQPIINDTECRYNFWTEACDGEFSRAQIEELVVLAREHVTAPEQSEKYEVEIYHYLERKYKALNAKDQKEIKNRYGYLKWLVENENRQEQEIQKKETTKKNRFNNFPQRTYDYEKLERMLLTTKV